MSKKNKKHFEFAKLVCGFIIAISGAVGVYAILKYYWLVEKAIEMNAVALPDGSVAVAAIGTIIGAFISYCFYQFGLKNSRNKYGIDETGEPYKTKISFDDPTIAEEPINETEGIVEYTVDEILESIQDYNSTSAIPDLEE